MAPADFHSLLRAKPFVPFRVVTSDGTVYQVNHPELCMVTFPSVIIGYPAPGDPYTAQRYDIVSMRHVVRLEPSPTPAEGAAGGPAGNGEQQ